MRGLGEKDVEAAFDWLEYNADACAKAKAERIYLVEYRKSLKAMLMSRAGEESGVAQEREAYAHPDYVVHLKALRDAVYADEKLQFQKAAALARIEAWQSMPATHRF